MHDVYHAASPRERSEQYVQSDKKSTPARRRLGHVCAALAIGGLPATLSAAATGIYYEVGPVTVKAHPTMTQGFSARVATEAIRAKTGIPGEPGVTIEPIESANVESIEQLSRYIIDPQATGAEITRKTYQRLLKAGSFGSILAYCLIPPVARAVGVQTQLQRRILATAVSLPAIAATTYPAIQPSTELASRDWRAVGSIEGNHYELEVSGGVAIATVKELQENEVLYDTLKQNTIDALQGVSDDPATQELVPILASSDHHCRVGMMRVEQGIIETLNIDHVINIGDLVEDGTIDFEQICIDIYEQRVIQSAETVVFVPGNHDGTKTITAMRDAGAIIGEGEIIELNGMKILADSDPRRNQAGFPRRLRDRDLSEEEFANSLTRKAQLTKPDILAVHDKKHAANAIPYADLTISGHIHAYEFDENGQWIQTGSAGSKKKDTYNFTGELPIPAAFVVLYQDRDTDTVAGHRVITVNPDKSVTVSEFIDRREIDEPPSPQLVQ